MLWDNLEQEAVYVKSYVLVSCALTVVEEIPKATAIQMIQDCQQEALIKLKGCRKLRGETGYRSEMASVTLHQETPSCYVD